ncbi:JmjC domain-containing histone demethylation protein 1 [Coniothyrium glycines]
MRRLSSFKAQYRQAPTRAATPPTPLYEPLSPTLAPAEPSTWLRAGSQLTATAHTGGCANGADPAPAPLRQSDRAQPQLNSLAVSYEPPLRSAPLPHTLPHFSATQATPVEALADTAVPSQPPGARSGDPSRHAAPPRVSPAVFAERAGESAPKHSFASDLTYAYNERPAKRARSEFHGSPHHAQAHSRPATSHIPGWSYNVEQMVDNGIRMYQDGRPSFHHQGGNGDDRISDAQLLLDFFNTSIHTAQTPPSTAKRWSMSHAELSAQRTQQAREPLSPHAVAIPSVAPSAQHAQAPTVVHLPSEPPFLPSAIAKTKPTAQTHTPPEEVSQATVDTVMHNATPVEDAKPKKHQGWPKGKPRGPRGAPSGTKRKRSTPKPKAAPSGNTVGSAEQLQSPLSLSAEQSLAMAATERALPHVSYNARHAFGPEKRRCSLSDVSLPPRNHQAAHPVSRARSLPLDNVLHAFAPPPKPARKAAIEQPDLICAACKSSESEIKVGDGEQWIGCDGCKEWYHYACAGFNSEREVRDVNKFYCEPCRPKFGETTKVRKSIRAHTTVDYAGLNEGVLKTSDDNPEHHYIAAFKTGDIEFTPESFARMPPELITGDFLEKTNGFKEPILVPGALNPRPWTADTGQPADELLDDPSKHDTTTSHVEDEIVVDDGQDKLDMVIPKGLTVRRVAELYGQNEPVPVIDVKAQEGEGKKWTMGKWADYYEQHGEKPVRNVISLEVSRSKLGKLIRRPQAVRDMDLQDSVWRDDDKNAPPPVQFYCLMSVADCFTDFHIDFGGSSVYYHIVKGRKVFFFIPPTKQNLKKYEDWCLSPDQGHDWLGKQVKECFRVDLYPGDTMLIPSGWIHAVWTPEDSLVIGGNFLTRIHYGMQIKVLEIEKNTKVALQFRYPFFQKIMWLTVIKYLEEDPIPDMVQQLLQSGEQFERLIPICYEPDRFGHNSHHGAANYNRRYYSKHELEGLTDVLDYIWRTVLIVEGKIDVAQKTRSAVGRSIPKGHGDPLVLARRFAMWIAWKRGNEHIPSWAYSDVALPETVEAGEKKLSAAQLKKLDRDALNEALRATAERSSARIRTSEQIPEPSPPQELEIMSQYDPAFLTSGPLTGFLRPSANNPHITTPKTSQLGPKRVACDACRKRRIRCKHKDELIDTSKPGMHTIDLSGSYGISVKRRLSDHSIADSQTNAAGGPVNGGPIMADVNGDPYALKSGRVKACADCRKSKRRCIHDEYGNVDPIKANEVPIPRGSASKKRRVSDDELAMPIKRMKYESAYEDDYNDGDLHTRHSMPHQFTGESSFLQDIAYSAQQALDQSPDSGLVPVDPALQGYANSDYTVDVTNAYPANGDTVISSVEYQPTDPMLMNGIGLSQTNGVPHGPSVEPLTPGPPPHNDPSTTHTHTNGYSVKPPLEDNTAAIRYPSSPVSPGHVSATSSYHHYLTSPTTTYNNFTTNTDFPPPPPPPSTAQLKSPTTASQAPRPRKTPSKSRNSKTPKSTPKRPTPNGAALRRRDSKDTIKLENGTSLSNGLSGGVDAGVGLFGGAVGGSGAAGGGGGGSIFSGTIDPNLDQASLELIKQLQQEDLGLRRRSR